MATGKRVKIELYSELAYKSIFINILMYILFILINYPIQILKNVIF